MTEQKPFKIIFALPEHADKIGEFNAKLALETENKVIDPSIIARNDRKLIEMASTEPHKETIKSSPGFYLVAMLNETRELIGQVMITYEMNLELGGLLYCPQSVYVEKDWRGKGVFRALFNEVSFLAKEDPSCKGLRLYVEKTNKDAILIYEKLGMDRQEVIFVDNRAENYEAVT